MWRWCAAILAAWTLAALITPPAMLIAAGGEPSAIGLLMFIVVMPAWSFGLVVILLVTYAAYVSRALYARSRKAPADPADDER